MGIRFNAGRKLQVKVGSFTCPAAAGDHSVIGLGFKPRYVEFMSGHTSAVITVLATGWMDYNGNQGTAAISSRHDTSSASRQGQGNCLYVIQYDNTTIIAATYVSMDSDGFTINFSIVDPARTIMWKAVR